MPTSGPGRGAIDLWKVDLDAQSPRYGEDMAVLSSAERRRAQRYCRAALRRRFVAGRAALRRILGTYLNRAPGAIRFHYGPRGKPVLSPPRGPAFNLAHSSHLALLAIAGAPAIGVDIERIRPRPHSAAIAARLFDPGQRQHLDGLAEAQRLLLFHALWTGLEARIKLRGDSLFGSDRACVSAAECVNFLPHPGFLAAVALASGIPPASTWRTYRYAP